MFIDDYFVDVLAKTPSNCSEIEISADASWKAIEPKNNDSEDEEDRPVTKSARIENEWVKFYKYNKSLLVHDLMNTR